MRRAMGVLLAVVALATWAAPRAHAHVDQPVAGLRLSLGWRDEPAYATLPNAAVLTVVDQRGQPVVDPGAQLSVTVSFGDATSVRPMIATQPGTYSADVVPTQPGEYGLHVTGTIAGTPIDLDTTCSDTTFHCVAAVDEIEFPARDSETASETASASAIPVAARADDDAGVDALALAALIVSVVAIVVSAVTAFAARSRRARSSP